MYACSNSSLDGWIASVWAQQLNYFPIIDFYSVGNVFVIAAIILERNLQNVANYLVASLAVADLLVACLVMPLGAVYEVSRTTTSHYNQQLTIKCFHFHFQISKGWILGPELCDIWTSCDVLCCTASILHLVAIAADRWANSIWNEYMYVFSFHELDDEMWSGTGLWMWILSFERCAILFDVGSVWFLYDTNWLNDCRAFQLFIAQYSVNPFVLFHRTAIESNGVHEFTFENHSY